MMNGQVSWGQRSSRLLARGLLLLYPRAVCVDVAMGVARTARQNIPSPAKMWTRPASIMDDSD